MLLFFIGAEYILFSVDTIEDAKQSLRNAKNSMKGAIKLRPVFTSSSSSASASSSEDEGGSPPSPPATSSQPDLDTTQTSVKERIYG